MLLVGNGTLYTKAAGGTRISDGCVAMDGTRIARVGTTAELRAAYPDAEWIDAHGGVILPGLINAHNHIYSAFARGLSIKNHDPRNFMDILTGLWWKLDRHLSLDDVRLSALATYIDCVRCGVTTVFDHHASYGAIEGSLFAIADAAREIGVRTSLCFEVSDRNGEDATFRAIAENAAFIRHAQADDTDMIAGMMGMHASFTLCDDTLARCRADMPEGIGAHIHVAEGMDDVYDSLRKHGKRVVHRLFDNDLLGPHTVTGHCIHINAAEMDILKATDTMVVHNPESNMGNAVGAPPVLTMMERDILLGLGTDGYTNDMFESMKVANILHKHNTCQPNVAWGEVPQMLFTNNARIAARSFRTPLGELAPDAAADVIVVDYDPLTPMDETNATSHVLFGMSGRHVVTTIAAGKPRMIDRELQGIDEDATLAHCRESAQKLWTRINAE